MAENAMTVQDASLTTEVTELVHEYEQPLLRYATRLLRNPDLAQDIVQETFIRYLKSRSKTDEKIDNPKAWLYRVAHNLALDHIRKNQRHVAAREDLTHKEEMKSGKDPAREAEGRDAEAAAWKMLETLPEREQQIVALKVVEGKSYKEIAEIMDLSVTNVGFILHTTMKKLAKRMRQILAPDR